MNENYNYTTIHNKDLEYTILSNLMNYQNLYPQYQEMLSVDLFEYPSCKGTFIAIKAISEDGDMPDLLTVNMYLSKNPIKDAPDAAELSVIYSFTVTCVNFERDLSVLVDMAKRRRYWKFAENLIKLSLDPTSDMSEADNHIEALREESVKHTSGVYDMKAINDALTERVAQNTVDEKANMITTGFKFIDEKGGFQLTDLNIIGGATSMGKTTLALNMLVNGAKSGVPSMFFSLEMTIEQVAARINAPISGVSSSLLLFKKLYTSQLRDFEKAKDESNALPIYIDDSSKDIETIKSKIRSMALKKGVKVFYIDFMQRILKPKYMRESEASFYENLSNDLKNLAKELKVCIVPLTQLNREARNEDPRPTLQKIKASSGIEQAADNVIFIYRPGYYGKRHKFRPELDPDNSAEIIIDKGRNYGKGSGYVGYKPELSLFYDLDAGVPEPVTSAPKQKELPF